MSGESAHRVSSLGALSQAWPTPIPCLDLGRGRARPCAVCLPLGSGGREGEILAVERLPDGSGLALRPADDRFAEKLALLRDTMKQYRNALRELSK